MSSKRCRYRKNSRLDSKIDGREIFPLLDIWDARNCDTEITYYEILLHEFILNTSFKSVWIKITNNSRVSEFTFYRIKDFQIHKVPRLAEIVKNFQKSNPRKFNSNHSWRNLSYEIFNCKFIREKSQTKISSSTHLNDHNRLSLSLSLPSKTTLISLLFPTSFPHTHTFLPVFKPLPEYVPCSQLITLFRSDR